MPGEKLSGLTVNWIVIEIKFNGTKLEIFVPMDLSSTFYPIYRLVFFESGNDRVRFRCSRICCFQ